MGFISHNAIVVTITSCDEDEIACVHNKAIEIFGKDSMVSPIIWGKANDTRSFFIAPDGSKEGWETSDDGDKHRAAFIAYIRSLQYSDGSGIHYVEVQYGNDNNEAKVINSSDDDYKNRRKGNLAA